MPDPYTFSWSANDVRRIESGPGFLSKLPEILSQLGMTNPLIVTGNSIATKTDIIARIQALLPSCCGVQSSIGEHAPVEGIHNGVRLLSQGKGDGVIAVGGGSPIDAAKAIIYFYAQGSSEARLKLVSIPTTLSAAEMTARSGFTSKGVKTGVLAASSTAIIYDAELALHTPQRLWLSTGIRALDHAVELQTRPGASLPVLSTAREAAAVLIESLRASAKEPKDVDARQRAFVGATLSLWPDALGTPLGPSHTIGYELGAPYAIPHGICSCITLGPVLSAIAQSGSTAEQESLAVILPFVSKEQDRRLGLAPTKERLEAVSRAVVDLVSDLGLVSKPSDYGVPKEDLPGIVERGLQRVNRDTSDPLCDAILKRLEAL